MFRGVSAACRRISQTVLPVVALVVIIAMAQAAVADPGDDDDSRKADVDRSLATAKATLEYATSRAQEAQQVLSNTAAQLPSAREEVARARGSVIASEAVSREAQRVAVEANAIFEVSQAAFDKANNVVKQEQEHLDAFARESYISGEYLLTAAVLAVQGPEEVVTAIGYMYGITALRDDVVQDAKQARMTAGQTRAAMHRAKSEADAADQAAAAALAEAQTQQRGAELAEANVATLVSQAEQATAVAEAERAASEAQYEELQAESNRLAVALRDAGEWSPDPAPARSGGRLLMPVNGWVSSDYGSRFDPYYGRWQLHAGTDFAAPGGAPIRAAEGGRVVRTGWNGGYGLYTCIYHGYVDAGGLSTCYAHQSDIWVSDGQWVDAGQTIGLVGTTGASTGDHLHFEVRLDGDPVDPMGWL